MPTAFIDIDENTRNPTSDCAHRLNATLSAIARERPASADELAKISGVGQSKLKRYGADVLKVVRAN
jgi:superfamily II DNA helicase RecQ